MRILKSLLLSAIFLGALWAPAISLGDGSTVQWTMGPWQQQGMVSWGADRLVVDFGSNGLWNFDGSWIRLSHWDPQSMVVWGQEKATCGAGCLVVDFGSHGLWNHDGTSWQKIALGEL